MTDLAKIFEKRDAELAELQKNRSLEGLIEALYTLKDHTREDIQRYLKRNDTEGFESVVSAGLFLDTMIHAIEHFRDNDEGFTAALAPVVLNCTHTLQPTSMKAHCKIYTED